MKIKTFRVKNFKSIKDITIEFKRDKGLWHITGGGTGNNVGKSALLEALKIHFTNVPNINFKRYVKFGESNFVTELYDWDGNMTRLSRGSDDFYEWDFGGGLERVNKTNGKVPEELVEYFNLYIEHEKTKEIVNYRTNDDKRLFTKTTEGDNFLLLQKALGTEDYTMANRKTKKLRNEVNLNIKVVNKQLSQENIENEMYKTNLADMNDSLDEISGIKAKVDDTFNKLNSLEKISKYLDNINKVNLYIDEVSDGLSSINFGDVKLDIEKLDVYKKLLDINKKIGSQEVIINKLNKVSISKKEAKEIKSKIDKLAVLDNMIVTSEKLSVAEKNVLSHKELVKGFKGLDELKNKIKALNKIEELIVLAEKFGSKNKEYKILITKEETALSKLNKFKEGFDICPFCEQDIPHKH